ncbi:TetR family transcriptional regulator [Alphaproteobacteria bacterium GH1-50]|uniref:TetR family transcriptional regulator n=1 Tax=Kangsaoukella pontilimi TaxID=2691042 RepID=A0A7C9IPF7_9RHOB|nr:TetR/AcrR family transcriptional regulator [Kangsaoukella pontilimi]MXQ06823.1 TetR family transcriptional regulator [Kangsaoukella pontilimi]
MANKKKYHHGDLRDALLDAIRQLIERDGPDGFSIAEACRMAGVSTAAPYKHFKDRGDMLKGIVLLGMERLYQAMQHAADAHPAGDPLRIVGLGRSYIDFAKAEPGVFRMMFSLAKSGPEDDDLRAAGDAANTLVERIVAEHLGIDPDGEEAKLRAYALWCFVHGHCFLMLDGKLEPGLTVEEEDTLLYLVGRAMLPPREDAG